MPRLDQPRKRRFAAALDSTSASPAIVISRMDRLRRADEHEKAALLAGEAVAGNPETAVGMLSLLHTASRHTDAETLLRSIASGDPVTCGGIIHALHAAGAVADADSLVGLLQERDVSDVVAAAVAFDRAAAASDGAAPTADNPLAVSLVTRPLNDLIAEVAGLRRERRDEEASTLLSVMAQSSPFAVFDAAAALARGEMTTEAGFLFRRYAKAAGSTDLALLFLRLTDAWESAAAHIAPIVAARPDAAAFLAALQTSAPEVPPQDCVGSLATWLTCEQKAKLCRALASQSAAEAVDDLIDWCARQDDARPLQAMLHDAEMHAAAYRLAGKIAEITGTYNP